MSFIKTLRITGDDNIYNLNVEYPETCPICHRGIDTRFIYGYVHDGHLELEVLYQCPYSDCRRLFVGHYHDPVLEAAMKADGPLAFAPPSGPFTLDDVAPIQYRAQEFNTNILSISEDFVNIYNQSSQAESLGLDKICGPGYRKSLEFLIKDYAILKHMDKETEIKKKTLSTVIREYIDDAKIKKMADRAAWLGNDETHYERKWGEKDINDLKKLINLTVLWIESEMLSEDLVQSMPEAKK